MPRRQNLSTKQRKAAIQEKRAIKRGDIAPPDPGSKYHPKKRSQHGRGLPPVNEDKIQSARKLQSSFLKHSPSFLAFQKELASTVPLPRSVPETAVYLPNEIMSLVDELGCPRRPKWRFDMTKKEVDLNEERGFAQWQITVQEKLEEWRGVSTESGPIPTSEKTAIKSPTYYEQNLEVWRQLWRVTEVSSIILVLLDSRCPPVHFPASLYAFLMSLKPARKIILVLTKTGVVGEERAQSWKVWLENRYPGIEVVCSESYRRKEGDEERKGQGARKHHEPYIPPNSLKQLISALQRAHKALLTPPEYLQDKPEKLAKWKPRVRPAVDWDAVLRSRNEAPPRRKELPVPDLNRDLKPMQEESDDELEEEVNNGPNEGDKKAFPDRWDHSLEPLTIGLIGQPNVGKSSLLNALFGAHKVKASRTPGKTKHFQTLFWTPEIRLVDCPGLVLPNYVPMELQALSSVLPISQIPSLPSCIRYIGERIPLEEVFGLEHPSLVQPAVVDKRTWRVPRDAGESGKEREKVKWTAMDVMQAYADKKGWVTAKAGRPDVNRAGNAILRTLAENRVRWAFWPPPDTNADNPESPITATLSRPDGLWIRDEAGVVESDGEDADNDNVESDEDDDDSEEDEEAGESEELEDEDDGDDDAEPVKVAASRFGALDVDDDDDDDDGTSESD